MFWNGLLYMHYLFSVFFISGDLPLPVGLMNEATNAFLNIAIAKKENDDGGCSELLLGSGSKVFPRTSFEPRGSACFFFSASVQQRFHYFLVKDIYYCIT